MKRIVQFVTSNFRSLVWIGIVVLGYTLCRRSILLSDEGYLLAQANEMAAGKVLYRDLDAFVAPGIWMLLAGVFKLFGPSVLITRFVSMACWLLTAFVVDRIVSRVATPVYAAWTLVALGVLSVWAFPAYHFAFYSAWATLLALATLERFLAWRRSRRLSTLVTAGCLAGLSIVFKQNYGVFATAALGLSVLVDVSQNARGVGEAFSALMKSCSAVALGLVLALMPVFVYFGVNDAFPDARHSLLVRPFSEFASQHTLPFPPLRAILPGSEFFTGRARYSYEAVPVSTTRYGYVINPGLSEVVDRMHILVYWAPLLLFTFAAFSVMRSAVKQRVDVDFFACLVLSLFVFLGVWPRADFNHLINVYQPVLVLGAVFAYRFTRPFRRSWLPGLLALLVGVPYALVAGLWYLLIVQAMPATLDLERGGVLLDPFGAPMLQYEVEKMRELTADGEPILTMSGLSMLNFLADRPQPGAYYNLYAVHIGHDGGRGVVRALEEEKPRLVIAEKYDYFADDLKMRQFAPELIEYLRRNYSESFQISRDQHWFLERRVNPLPAVTRTNLLPACDGTYGGFVPRVLVSSLRYDIINNRFRGPGAGSTRTLSTICNFIVPANASVTFNLGYRQPDFASDDAAALVTVAIGPWDDTEPEVIVHEETLPILAVSSWSSPPPEPRSMDLSAWAGRNVRLTLRVDFRGEASPNPFDLEGFSVTLADLQIETPPKTEANASAPTLAAN